MHITLLPVVRSIKKRWRETKESCCRFSGFACSFVRNAELQLIFSLLRTKQTRFISQEATPSRTICKIYVENDTRWFLQTLLQQTFQIIYIRRVPCCPVMEPSLTHILTVRLEVFEHESPNHKSTSWQQMEVFVFVTGGQGPQSSHWSVYGWASTSVTVPPFIPGASEQGEKKKTLVREGMGSWICILVLSQSKGDLSCNQCDWKPLLSWLN